MAPTSLYRALPAEKRTQLVLHMLARHKEARPRFIGRLVSRGGGFRAVTMQNWPAAQLAREVVRLNAQTAMDEVDLLQALYLEVEPQYQVDFLDAAGIKHEGGVIPEDMETPYASAEAVAKAAKALQAKHGEAGLHYLQTIARFNGAAWPGLHDLVG